MNHPIRLLHLEDDPRDAELIRLKLKAEGLSCDIMWVNDRKAFESALAQESFDVVLSDYDLKLPDFDGMSALKQVREKQPDLPVIVISGTLGEEAAVECLRAGANDYVLKQRLPRFAPAVLRAISEARERVAHRRAERELAETRSRLDNIVSSLSDVVWSYSLREKRLLYVSAAVEEVYGRPAAAFYENPDIWRDTVHPDDRVRVKAEREAGLEAGRFESVYRVVLPDGGLHWIQDRVRVIRDENGRPVQLDGLARDITDRKNAEQALRESEAGLRQAEQIAKLAHAISGPDGSFESWSETLPALIQMPSARLPKSTREWLTLLHPDERAMFRDQSIEAGKKRTRVEIEYRLRRGDGAWIDIRHLMEPLQEGVGTAGRMRWFSTIQDVTEQKRAAEAVRKAQLMYRAIFENAVEGIFLVNAEGRVVSANPMLARMLGYESPEQMGKEIGSVAREVYVEKGARGRFRELVNTRTVVEDFETQWRRKDGSTFWVSLTARLMGQETGGLIHHLGMARDITERKAAETRIRRLSRVYAVLSGINAAIVRIRDREELFREACRIAVDAGGFKFVWLAVVDREQQQLRPVASAGDDNGFLEAVRGRMSLRADAPEGQGAAVRAVTEKKAIVVNDVERDPRIRYKKEHADRGIRSVAVLPLFLDGEATGAIGLHSGETGFFDEEEMRLLLELAGDISFALEHFEKTNRLDYLAFYDSVTGLANRTLFLDRLNQYVHAAGSAGDKVALVLADVERFRTVNDSLGRQAGDALLKQLAGRLAHGAGNGELARIGVDVFAIVLQGVKGKSEVTRRIERTWHDCFSESIRLGDSEIRISARAGVALFPNDGADAETLLRNAEAALRRAKETSERHVFHSPEMTEKSGEKLTLETKLRQALENEEFVLHYQPKVDLETRRIVGMEALIRWQSPELGLVPPMKFIPLMEETGLILQAGPWALKRASLDHRRWAEQGLAAPRIAVNVSAIQLRQRDFVGAVEQAIKEGIAPTGIDLEITESLIMEDVEGNIRKLKEVRALGMSVAIDDFGTGYSSLAYLAKLPVQTLKIDRAFIITMLNDPDTMTLVQTMISLAHSLRLTVVAEGVDAEEQAKMLRLLRCDQMQGYLFSRPVPFDEITALLKQGQKA